MLIIFASNNKHKISEISLLLGDHIQLKSLEESGIFDDIPEEEPTLEGNALSKARFVFERTGEAVFADDTGLETEALDGSPGVKSARFAGNDKDSDANIEKLLTLLKDKKNRKARFRTVIALIINHKEHIFEGIIEGTIIDSKRGRGGFGYDPVFVPEGSDRTFAEMTIDEKNTMSHRAIAFNKLKDFLHTIII